MSRSTLTRTTGTAAALTLVALLLGIALPVAAMTPRTSATPSPTPSPTPTVTSVVALGDSIPFGLYCRCTPFPQILATRLSSLAQTSVTAANDAIPGFQTSDVLRQLTTSSQAMSDVSSADVVTIEVGANDVGYSNRCRVNVACYRPQLQSFVRNLRAIVARVQQLSSTHGVTIALVDYWNVWLGGKYAAKRGAAYVRASNALTDQLHALTMATALDTNSVYVDLESAFKGPSYANDETRYLAADGDHANAAGQQLIAKAVLLAVRPALHL